MDAQDILLSPSIEARLPNRAFDCNFWRVLRELFHRNKAILDTGIKLEPRQFGVDASMLKQALMRSFLDNASLVENEDAIGLEDCCQAVGDHKSCARLYQVVQRL